MFWKFGQTLLTKKPLLLYGERRHKLATTSVNERVVYLGHAGGSFISVVLGTVFDAVQPSLTKKNTCTRRKIESHFKGQINIIPAIWFCTEGSKEKRFEYLL